jgi:hypothetical protein
MAQLVHVPIDRAGAVLTLACTVVSGASSTGERSGAVVIPQCVGESSAPTESDVPAANSALNHSECVGGSAVDDPQERLGFLGRGPGVLQRHPDVPRAR